MILCEVKCLTSPLMINMFEAKQKISKLAAYRANYQALKSKRKKKHVFEAIISI